MLQGQALTRREPYRSRGNAWFADGELSMSGSILGLIWSLEQLELLLIFVLNLKKNRRYILKLRI